VFLAQGICVGAGEGITYIPALAVIASHFTTKRPIAIGIASLGSVAGGIIFPIMFRKLQPQIGFGWSVRAIAFINLTFAIGTVGILGRHKSPSQPARGLVDFTALHEPAFMLFASALFFLFLAYYVPLFFITSYANVYLGTSENFAFYLLSITNAGSLLGRTVPYLLGARLKPIYTLVFAAIVGVILAFTWISIHETPSFIAWCVLWGFVAGVLVTAPTSTMLHRVMSPSLSVIGTRLGMSWSAAAVGSLIGAPVAGALTDIRTASFVHAQAFTGAAMAAGALCLVWPLIAIERYDKRKA
jgi:predicted MFS family arabinose efflux permease